LSAFARISRERLLQEAFESVDGDPKITVRNRAETASFVLLTAALCPELAPGIVTVHR